MFRVEEAEPIGLLEVDGGYTSRHRRPYQTTYGRSYDIRTYEVKLFSSNEIWVNENKSSKT